MVSINKKELTGIILLALQGVLLFGLFSLIPGSAIAALGNPNATVQTFLNVGNVFPEVLNVSVEEDAASVSPTANTTRAVYCAAVIRDYNGEGDISVVNGTFYGTTSSSHEDTDDNNYHYTNTSCTLNDSFVSYNGFTDDAYHTLANCSFQIEYYANPETWNCNVTVQDNTDWIGFNYDPITMDQLLAVGLPDIIHYGTVNATEMSGENVTNVTNLGNVALNLSLEGYGHTQGDGNAMNCTLGNVGNISIEHEKFNLTGSNTSTLTLAQANSLYTNLTTTPVIYDFDLEYRQNDVLSEAWNQTYWRIYVPQGVAGTCTGNIIFGATTADGV